MKEASLAREFNPTVRNGVFLSYSHKDKRWLGRVQGMLKPVVRDSGISIWSDREIPAGAIWRKEIENALSRASVAVLLVSSNFLASDFIMGNELHPVLRAASCDGVKILWICLEPCLFEETCLAAYQAVYDPLRPLSRLRRSDQDVALVELCRQVKSHICNPIRPENQNTPQATNYIATIELHLSQPLEQFNEEEFRTALGDLIGAEVNNVRIASIRRGSTIVVVEGSQAAISKIIDILRSGSVESRRFVQETKLERVGEPIISFAAPPGGVVAGVASEPTPESTVASTPRSPEIEGKIKQIIANITGLSVVALDNSAEISDLYIDSLSLLEISVDIDMAFGLNLPDETYRELSTIQGAVDLVQRALADRAASATETTTRKVD